MQIYFIPHVQEVHLNNFTSSVTGVESVEFETVEKLLVAESKGIMNFGLKVVYFYCMFSAAKIFYLMFLLRCCRIKTRGKF